MSDLRNELSWSFSRHQSFTSCRRRYYYQYYLSWGGWEPEAPQARRHAYRLKQMQGLDALAGNIVHEGIADALEQWRRGTVPILAQSLHTARLRWRRALDDSESGRWMAQPKHFSCILEHYYEDLDREGNGERAIWCIETCLTNFYDSPTWKQMQNSRPKYWLASDLKPFVKALLDGVPVYARPDFGYGRPASACGRWDDSGARGKCRVFDWKTGKPRGSHHRQLRYYVLFAEKIWGFSCSDISARLVYLSPSVQEENHDFTPDQLEEARQELHESWAQMKAVLSEVETNTPLDMAEFPVTTQSRGCRYCAFQEICTDRVRS